MAIGGCALIAAGTVAGLTAAGPGSQPRARSAAVGTGRGSPADRLNVTGSAPVPFTSMTAAPSPRATPSARPAAAAGSQDPFGAAAASYLSGRAGTVLAAVYDIGTGRTWRLGLRLAEHGQDDGAGLSDSDRLLTEQMIEYSDNDAATSLWYEVGGAARISSFNARAGLTRTAPSSCVVCPGFSWPGWGLTTTTPDDQLALLRQLVAPSPLLTGAERDYALSLMEDVTPAQRWGISGGVPAQVTVALKNGWLPLPGADGDWQVNSVGWISGQGRNYLIAVLTTGNPSAQYGVDTIGQLAAMVWQGMR